MAGRMTTADFTLILDSIDEAVRMFAVEYGDRVEKACGTGVGGTVPSMVTVRVVDTLMRRSLGKSFANRLRYTNDSFDADRFERSVLALANNKTRS